MGTGRGGLHTARPEYGGPRYSWCLALPNPRYTQIPFYITGPHQILDREEALMGAIQTILPDMEASDFVHLSGAIFGRFEYICGPCCAPRTCVVRMRGRGLASCGPACN